MSRPKTDTVLEALAAGVTLDLPAAIVVAHPDDETIGLGPFLARFRRLRLIHVTDGAPRDLRDANAAGFASCAAYATARRTELQAALLAGGCPDWLIEQIDWRAGDKADGSAHRLPVADQSASDDLAGLAACLRAELAGISIVFTHPYEGGHPDHDAVAFAVQATGVPAIEMAGYHATPDGGIEVGRFLPGSAPRVIKLTRHEQERRDAMLACFTTQRQTLAPFVGWTEALFRPAPHYDFTRPPAPRAYYDGFAWGMTSDRWCALASEALATMGPSGDGNGRLSAEQAP